MTEPTAELVTLGAPFHVDGLTLSARNGVTFEEAGAAALKLKQVHGALHWWIGDLIRLTEGLFHEEASQIIDQEFLDEKTITECRAVSASVGPDMRLMAPSWEHAKAISRLKPAEQKKFLQMCLDDSWTAAKLKSEVDAKSVGGKSGMRFILIVDAGTEAKQTALAKALEKDGYSVTKRTGIKRVAKTKKGKASPKKLKAVAKIKRTGGRRPYAPKKKRVQ